MLKIKEERYKACEIEKYERERETRIREENKCLPKK